MVSKLSVGVLPEAETRSDVTQRSRLLILRFRIQEGCFVLLVQVFMTLIEKYTLIFDGVMAVGLFNFFSGVTQAECSTRLFFSLALTFSHQRFDPVVSFQFITLQKMKLNQVQ